MANIVKRRGLVKTGMVCQDTLVNKYFLPDSRNAFTDYKLSIKWVNGWEPFVFHHLHCNICSVYVGRCSGNVVF